ncbi:MAG: hypothetical protein J5965_08930 [Aeriscardovia sp.]|nr:hypothetical protein [Aeriscardovia sp.]
MDFDNMKKDKDFQKWCFDTDLVGNKNWFNLENGSGDEVYIAYEAWVAGQQSKQAEVDELRKRIDEALDHAVNHGGYDDLTHIINILKGDQS